MDYKIVTPMMLWQDYNPTKQPLEVTILNMSSTDDILCKEVVFTAETVSDGKVRAYAKMILQKNAENAPTLLYIPAASNIVSAGIFLDMAIKNGYNMVIIDYSGDIAGKEHFTTYPESLKYCYYSVSKNDLYKPSAAKDTPWYIWMKIVRRAITLISEETAVDKDRIALLGYLEGAQIAWQVAGIDGRIKAVVPIGGCGYLEYFNKFKYTADNSIDMSEILECWLAGISPQAYARLILCPVFYMAGTNSAYADMDRINDFFSLIPSEKKYISLSAGTNHNIAKTNFEGLFSWLNKYLISNGEAILSPVLSTYISDGRLYASIKNIENNEKIEIYYSTDEINPSFRSWVATDTPLTVGDNECIVPIKVYDDTKLVFMYSNVTYKDGLVLSTREAVVNVKTKDITVFDTNSKAKSRFVYVSSNPFVPFTIETDYPVVNESGLVIEKGPNDIRGIGVLKGRLCTYHIEPPEIDDSDLMLQMDIYSKEPCAVTVNFYTAEKGTQVYSINISLNGFPRWQRVNIERSNCKTQDMRPLKDWNSVRKMEIINAAGVLFNNILWV